MKSKRSINIQMNKLKQFAHFGLTRVHLDLDPTRFNAILIRKDSRVLLGHLYRLVRVISGKLTPNLIRLTAITLRRFMLIRQRQGLMGLCKYLKVLTTVIQQIAGGHFEKDLTPLGPRISRNSSGVPRVFPIEVRKKIKDGDPLYCR